MLTLISVNMLINTDENVTLKIKNETITNKSNQKLFVYYSIITLILLNIVLHFAERLPKS